MLVTAMDHSQRRLSMGMMTGHEAEYLDLAGAPQYGLQLEHSHSMGMPHGHYLDDQEDQYDLSGQIVSPKNNAKPSLYKTELCKRFSEYGSCRYGAKCQFAHGMPELRHVLRHPKYKTTKCKSYWGSGHCPYGSRCRFIHEEEPVGRGYKSSGLSPRNEISPTSQGDLSFLNAQYNSDLPPSTGLMPYNADLGMLNGQSSPTWLGGEVASTPTFMRSPSEQSYAPKTSPIGPPKKSPSMSNVLDNAVEYNGLQDAIGVLLKFSQSFPEGDGPAPPVVGASSPKVGLPPTVPAGSSLKSPLKRDLSLQADELWKEFSAVSIGGSGDAAEGATASDWFLGGENGSNGLGGPDLREDSSRLSFFTQFK